MKRTNILKRPFYLGLALFSAFALTAATAPSFAQDAAPADNAATAEATPVENAEAAQPTAEAAPAENVEAAQPTAEAAPVENAETAQPTAEAAPAENAETAQPTAEAAPAENAETAQPTVEAAPAENAENAGEPVSSAPSEAKEKSKFYLVLFALVAFALLAWAVAVLCAKRFRQPQFRAAYFIVFFCFVGGLISTITGLKAGRVNLGVDLRGGSILVYEVSPSDASRKEVTSDEMNDLKNALSKRINPSGVREISIQELGANTEIRITIPEADEAEVDRLERVINNAGQLKFRILAVQGASDSAEARAVQLAQSPENANAWTVVLSAAEQADGVKGATWIPVDPAQEDSVTARNVTRPSQAQEVKGLATPRIDVLTLDLVDIYNVDGDDLAQVNDSFNNMMTPEIVFEMKAAGAEQMRALTTKYEGRQMGVVMNERLHSAPNINEPIGKNGSITFGQNLSKDDYQRIQKDVDDLVAVMRAGVLPAKLSDEPVTKMTTGPTLGADTIAKGKNAVIWSGVIVLLFMIAYYGFGGLIATFAVLMNLVMIMSMMIAMRAAFTLPGLAGLVLTVGMAVDANILIFERIREELNGGAALRMAVRNGYQRAFTAIFDSNITTMLTAWILYLVGSEQIKSFAVTLFLGVLFSMFTATYVCRVIFETCEKNGWLTKRCVYPILPGLKPIGRYHVDFYGMSKKAAAISCAIILVGLAAVVARGKGIFDVDFVGGVEVQAVFTEPVEISEVRSSLSDLPDLTVGALTLAQDSVGNKVAENTCYSISASCPPGMETADFEKDVQRLMKEKFAEKMPRYTIDAVNVGDAQEVPVPGSAAPKSQIAVDLTLNRKMSGEVVLAYFDEVQKAPAEAEAAATEEVATLAASFAEGVDATQAQKEWTVLVDSADKAQVEALAQKVAAAVAEEVAFEASSTIGSSVAGYARAQGVLAILGSLLCIVAYLWLRFKRAIFGISAVVGLIHDVLFVLGLIGLSYWLAPFLGFLGINQFKIGLATVAAFLTLIGYSLNDTIILFDRIREVRGKSEALTKEIVNRATNECLSRTLLTSLTTLFTALVLYAFGGAGIHTFAFAMSAGVIVGTFSSIFICAPFLLWLLGLQNTKTPSNRVQKTASTKKA